MTDAVKRVVIVGFDGSDQARDAVALAEPLCAALGGQLVLACVFPYERWMSNPSHESDLAAAFDEAEATLMDAPLRAFRSKGVELVAVPASSPARGLHDLVLSRNAALLVLGSSHRGAVGRVLPGGVGRRLIHGAPHPVAIAPRGYASRAGALRTIAAAFDGTEEAQMATFEAAEIALQAGAALRVIAVVDTAGSMYLGLGSDTVLDAVQKDLEEQATQLAGSLPAELRPEIRLLRGHAARTLLAEAERDVDLLVLGSRGYGPLGTVLLGGVSSEVADSSPCPVLLVPRGAEVKPPASQQQPSSRVVGYG
jgi:nucleotide-binding universal stress UspA family protein